MSGISLEIKPVFFTVYFSFKYFQNNLQNSDGKPLIPGVLLCLMCFNAFHNSFSIKTLSKALDSVVLNLLTDYCLNISLR